VRIIPNTLEKFLEEYEDKIWHYYVVTESWRHTDLQTFIENQFDDFLNKRGLWVPKVKENLTSVRASWDTRCEPPPKGLKRSLINLKRGKLASLSSFMTTGSG
jgi:hypothetical protein